MARGSVNDVANTLRAALSAQHGDVVGELWEDARARCGGSIGVGGYEARVYGEVAIVRADAIHVSVESRRRHSDGRVGRRAVERLELLDAELLAVELRDAHLVVPHDFRKVLALHDGHNHAADGSNNHCDQNGF